MIQRDLEYQSEDRTFSGFLAYDESSAGPRPGVIVCHEGTGLAAYTRYRASILAEVGYVAFAPDLFGQKVESREQMIEFIRALRADTQRLRGRASAALDRLKSLPEVDPSRTAAIGYCFGGLVALEMARAGYDLRGVVSFHGALHAAEPMHPSDRPRRIFVCTGADDPFVNAQQRSAFEQEMTKAGADWQMVIYGKALHAFTNKDVDPAKFPGCAYDALADHRSWRAMRDFLEEVFEQ